jgi:hypothetical protein
MAYIYPAPGNATHKTTLNLKVTGDTLGLDIPALQDVTLNAANDVFTWTQLDTGSKLQIATTATNSLGCNIVVEQASFFGTTVASEAAKTAGVFGLSGDKTKVNFELYLGSTDGVGSGSADGKTISGSGYITGLAPTVSADSPVWVTPITITVDGDYTVS